MQIEKRLEIPQKRRTERQTEIETFFFPHFFLDNIWSKKVRQKSVKNWVRCFVCVFFLSKCSIDGFFFTVNSMILIEYGFVIAGSEIREKKEFF
jgi:hypothetical protein